MSLRQPFTLGELYNHLAMETAGTVIPPGRRAQISLACFHIVREHHHAIAIMLDEGLYASAFALMRPLYEAAVKGMWLGHCAEEGRMESYATGTEVPAVGELVDDLLKSPLPSVVSSEMRRIKMMYWKVMSSLTHAGHAQVRRWLTATGVAPTYSKAEVTEVATFTTFVATVASLEVARLGQNADAIAALSALLPKQSD